MTAVDLLEKVMERSNPKRWERSEQRVHGYRFWSWMLQAPATEHLLKSLSIRDSSRIRKTPDLLQLLKGLDPDTQVEITRQATQQGIDMPELLRTHRHAFVVWQYPVEEMSAIPEAKEFDDVLAALVGVCEPGNQQAGQMPEQELEVMQVDYVLCPTFPDRTDETIRYHVHVLENEDFLETRALRSRVGGSALETVRYFKLSRPLAADRFLEKSQGPPN